MSGASPANQPVSAVRVAPSWPRWRRFVLNFGTVYFALYFLLIGQPPLPLLSSQVRFALADGLNQLLFHKPLPTPLSAGSGDSSQDWALTLLGVLLSLLLAGLWTALWRCGPARRHPTLLSVGLRAALIFWLYSYGLAKFSFGQFGLLAPGQLIRIPVK